MQTNNKVPEFSIFVKNLKENAVRMAANEAQKFFKESFVKGGFTDKSLQRWPSRKSSLGGRKIMYGQGVLRDSIRPTEQGENRIVVTSDTPYSELHNKGGVITVTAQMKKWWWAQYYKLSGKMKKTKSGKVSGSAANRQLSAKAEYCKNMALMKVGSKIKMPKRQFMGHSDTLMKQFEQWAANEIETKFNG